METSRLARSLAFASFLGTALVGGALMDAAIPEEAEAGFDVDESYFYVSLSSQGTWVQNAQFGWVWYPSHRDRSWRPYTVGSWVWTDDGEWMWVSDEPFGWATYHYGRWFLDPVYGWVWLPGRVWAPAWVSWRDCDDYIGWAPLGPWGYYDSYSHRYRDWDRYGGYHGGGWNNDHDGDWDHDNHGDGHGGGQGHGGHYADRDGDDADHWNFTRKRDFASSRVDRVVLDRRHLSDVYRRSRELPPPSEQDERAGRGTTRVVDHRAIERASGRPIRPVRIEDGNAPGEHGRGQESRDHVKVFRPHVSEKKPDSPTPDRLGTGTVPRTDRRPSDGGNDDRGASHDAQRTGRDNGTRDNSTRDTRGDHGNRGHEATGRDAEPSESLWPKTGQDASPAQERRPGHDSVSGNDGSTYDRGSRNNRPAYDSGSRNNDRPSHESVPRSYERPARETPPPASDRPSYDSGSRNNDRPSHESVPRNHERPSYDSGSRDNDRPSHQSVPRNVEAAPHDRGGHSAGAGAVQPAMPAPPPMPGAPAH